MPVCEFIQCTVSSTCRRHTYLYLPETYLSTHLTYIRIRNCFSNGMRHVVICDSKHQDDVGSVLVDQFSEDFPINLRATFAEEIDRFTLATEVLGGRGVTNVDYRFPIGLVFMGAKFDISNI